MILGPSGFGASCLGTSGLAHLASHSAGLEQRAYFHSLLQKVGIQ